ncbi:gliding motility-associated C-terminal domain-containing protein [Flavobacterium sp. HSC-61S13]|uniref:HYR-like domain-containing protein n=1 Tax=Flavobacterium sp. HSC-61S13 TaxID=2910963 RepID=UPI00209D3C40|nr:gliding motility-associated C-terminal domain-containing protein [Flavobacterium sp. HSC-61S13]MCP1996378.1 gliding motility-associated-like protein [Flavobacterium sp. HSC-61S13]
MNYKITLMRFFAIFRNRVPIPMVALFSFMLLLVTSATAQTLKTDSNVPLLSVCGDYQQLTVRIGKGSRACNQGKLKIEIPAGFELQTGSVKANGNTVTVSGETGQGVTANLPSLTAGPSSEEMVITYNVKALCSVIGSAVAPEQQVVSYTFSGCTTNPQSGTSEIINIDYAILRVSINPAVSSGKVGDEIMRTVTIRNQGNGAISTLVLERLLGNGLSHVSYETASALGWTVDATNPNKITFSGSSLGTGGTISFKEKVKINSCSLTPTIYEVYYGCTTKCTNSNVNGTAQHIINIDNTFKPSLAVTAVPPVITCFNQTYTNTWNVKNTGNAEASSVGFEIGTNDVEGYININSLTIGGIAVNPADIVVIEGTATKPTRIKVNISADNTLDPNQTVVVKFDQFYGAPSASSCETAPTSFTTNDNYYSLSYDFTGGCGGPYADTKTVSSAVTYTYEGLNIGEIDIVSGQPYGADYLFTDFVIPSAGLNIGDKFDITIELSDLLTVANINDIKLFSGASAVNAVPSADGANKYRLTFTYGSQAWPAGQDLNLSNSRLKFPIDFLCDGGEIPGEVQDVWYKIGGELIKTPGCAPVSFKCNQVDLLGYCDAGPCADGLHNRSADLERTTLGFAVNASGVPTNTPVDKNNTNVRTFITGDVLEVYQDSDVIITSAGAWTKVKFQIEKDADTNVQLLTTAGSLVVTRGGVEFLFDGLTVVENPTNYVLQFDLATQPNTLITFAQGDKVRFSMKFKALDSQVGLKKFPTKSYLIDSNGVEKICGRAYTATGFYVNNSIDVKGSKTDFTTCSNSDNKFVITSSILGFSRQDGVFEGEFRNLFQPTKAVLTVPAFLTLTGMRVEVKNQPWLGINNTATISGLNVNNGTYIVDLISIISGLTGNKNLDEGFVIEITPTVSLFECEPSATALVQSIGVTLEGDAVDGAGIKTPFSKTQQLDYNTGFGSLTLELSNNNLDGDMSPDGQIVSWVVKIANTSDSRSFANVWLGKKAGNLVIQSVQKVDNYDGTNPLVAVVPNGDVYRLGDFSASTTNYYLIKANLINCNIESLTIPVGYSCTAYPVDINSGVCVVNDKVLTYSQLKNNLQTTIAYQSNANTQHGFCDVLSYTIQIHNGGDTNVKNLSVRIPLATAPGLKYNNSFKYSAVFTGNITPGAVFSNGNPANAVINGTDLIITLGNGISLNTLERIQLKVDFKIETCEFRSGQRISFLPSAQNVCGSALPQGSITSASGNRIIVAGGSTAFPEMVLNKHEVRLDPVLTVGGNLRAVYNFSTVNSGNFGNTDAITTDYRFAFKFPADWAMVGNPNDYLVPAGVATFEGIDPVRGYIYKVTKNIPVGTEVKLVNVPLKYTANDDTTLSCEHNFGEVKVSIYQNIAVPTCVNPNLNCPDGIDQVLIEDEIPMILPIDTMLMINPPQQTREICSPLVGGGQPTLADITFSNGYYLTWYENEQDALAEVAQLPITTQLIHDRTYYVVNRFIAGGLCKSNVAAIKVLLKTNNLKATNIEFACSVDQKSYKMFVTLNGTAPYIATGTGAPGVFNGNVWTSESIDIGKPYDVTFENASLCTPLTITGIPPVCCTLQIACPADVEVLCGSSYDPSVTGIPTAVTSCGNTTYEYADSAISNCVAGLRTFTRTFTVTDASGNVETCVQTISIKDLTAPVLNIPAANLAVECGTDTATALNNWLNSHGGAVATDACSAVTWTHNYTSLTAGACSGTQAATVTFTATDACGNRISTTAIFKVEDKTPPTISLQAADKTVECDGTDHTVALNKWLAEHGGATATDGCSAVTWTHNFTALTAGSCAGSKTATVIFTATDACGNASKTTATFNVVDTTAPVITVAPVNKIVECDGNGNLAEFNAWLADHAGAVATDNCGAVTWTYLIEDTNTTCGKAGTVIVDFIASDSCGNKTFKQAVFIIKDTIAPIIDQEAKNLTIECGAEVDALNAWLNNHGGAISSDNCGTITWTHDYNGLTAACGNTGSALVTFTATDSCGNKSTTQATVKVEDKTPPVIVKQAQNLTTDCGPGMEDAIKNWLIGSGHAVAQDNCGAVTWTHNYIGLTTRTCGVTGTALVTFTATDACGNIATTAATLKIENKIAPKLIKEAQNKIVECDGGNYRAALDIWLLSHGGAIVAETCSEVTWVDNFTTFSGGDTGTAEVTFVATDACGNKISTTATYTIVDNTAPVFSVLPQNKTVECDGKGNLVEFQAWLDSNADAVATDACGAVTWSYLIEDTNTTCGKAGTVIVDFIAKDAFGNKTIKQGVFIIKDTTAPIIETAAKDLTIECGASVDALNAWLNNHGGAVSTDNCGTITWSHNYNGLTAACGTTGSAIVTFTATDSCGNKTETIATVKVVDTIAPIMVKQAQDLTVSCGADTAVSLNNWLISHGGAVAKDNCGAVTWKHDFTALTTTACGATGSALVTFTATDACGNEVVTKATYSVDDKTAPIITKQAQNKTVECDGSGNTTELTAWLVANGGATATDSCSDLTWTNDYTSLTKACGETGSVIVTFTATDACGNTVKTTATFTIVDTKAPVMTTLPKDEVVECDGAGNQDAFNTWLNSHAGAVATDACSTVLTWSHNIVDTSNLCGKTKVTTVNFVVTDACGNATTKQASFTIADTTGPILTTAATNLTMECGTSGNERIATWLNNHGGATATEACGTVTWSHNYKGLTAACGATGNAEVVFTATDSCGNTTTTIATVSIVDTVAPTLTKEAQNLTVSCGTNTKEALDNWLINRGGAKATDTCSAVTWSNDYVSLTAACGSTGSALVTFTATDACGNTVTSKATFTIEDKTAPVITKTAQNKTVECDGSGNTTELQAWLASQGGAQATDACSAVTWTNDYTSLNKACGATGNAEVTFTATDACGNKVSTTAVFTVIDTKAPVMTTSPQNLVVECDGRGNVEQYNAWIDNHGGAVVTDACSAVTWTHAVVETKDLCGKTKAITVNFIATDACGNSISKSATFTTENTTGPQFEVQAKDLTVDCDGSGNANDLSAWLNTHGGAVAVNACSVDFVWTNDFKGLDKACGSTGSTKVTFTVKDSCGNVSTTTATFTIVDKTAPVFTTNLPKDITLECSAMIPDAAILNATDLCGTAEVSFKEQRENGNCENNYQLVRTWTATDACGNAKTHVQTITIQDTTAPVFVDPLPAAVVFIKCEDLKDAPVLTATDNCGKVTVAFNEEKVQGDCENKYSLLRTWTATDSCGNESTYTQTVHLACEIEIYNAVSANGDGNNDALVLKGLNCYPGNTVEIFNRWGRLVYSTTNYNTNGNVFRGFANAKDVVSKEEKLPTGTYFYIVQYDYNVGNGQSEHMKQSGYIHLESN